MDVELADGTIKAGEWRAQVTSDGGLQSIKTIKGGRRKLEANNLRENLKVYFNSEIGSVPWQNEYVRSVGKTL